MRTVSIFKTAITAPSGSARPDFDGVSELRSSGKGQHHLRPVRPTGARAAGQGRSGLYGGA